MPTTTALRTQEVRRLAVGDGIEGATTVRALRDRTEPRGPMPARVRHGDSISVRHTSIITIAALLP
jgi:hypothetical protein